MIVFIILSGLLMLFFVCAAYTGFTFAYDSNRVSDTHTGWMAGVAFTVFAAVTGWLHYSLLITNIS